MRRSFARRPVIYVPNWASSQARGLLAWYPLDARFPGDLLHGARDLVASRDLIDSVSGTLNLTPTAVAGLATTFQRATPTRMQGTHSILNFSSSFSISCWLRQHSYTAGDYHCPISHRNSPGGAVGTYGFYSAINTGITPDFYIYTSSAWQGVTGSALTLGQTYHLVGTYDAAATTLAIYINGKLDNANVAVAGTFGSLNIPVSFGYDYIAITPQNSFDGTLTDVRFYDHALSPQEIAALYNPITRWELYNASAQHAMFGTTTPAFLGAWAARTNVIPSGGYAA